jgi:phage terminase small subunit
MAKGGRRVNAGAKRKPFEKNVIEGTFRKDRHGNPPQVAGSFPQPPGCLTEAERKLWETLPKPGWIIESDVVAVHAAVSIYERILRNQRAQAATDDAGAPLAFKTVITERDNKEQMTVEAKENPLITQELKLWGRLMSILATLGLTPVDRAKMQAPKDDAQDDKWAGIL